MRHLQNSGHISRSNTDVRVELPRSGAFLLATERPCGPSKGRAPEPLSSASSMLQWKFYMIFCYICPPLPPPPHQMRNEPCLACRARPRTRACSTATLTATASPSSPSSHKSDTTHIADPHTCQNHSSISRLTWTAARADCRIGTGRDGRTRTSSPQRRARAPSFWIWPCPWSEGGGAG